MACCVSRLEHHGSQWCLVRRPPVPAAIAAQDVDMPGRNIKIASNMQSRPLVSPSIPADAGSTRRHPCRQKGCLSSKSLYPPPPPSSLSSVFSSTRGSRTLERVITVYEFMEENASGKDSLRRKRERELGISLM